MDHIKNVSLNARITFRCERCGRCCRNLKNALMIDPFDIYNLSKHLREQGRAILGPEDMLGQYAQPDLIDGVYPIFQLNTAGADDACIFYQDGRCSVYEARPQVCRMYPFGTQPGAKGRDFYYYLCTERPHHFENGTVIVKDWIGANFSKEARDFLKMYYQALPELGKAMRSLSEQRYKRMTFHILYYLYYGYDLSKPFLPQYQANIASLMEKLAKEMEKECESCMP